MSDFVSFAVQEIEKLGLVCPNCKSELVITFQKDKPTMPAHKCPVCLADQKPFARYKPDWLEWMRTLKDAEDAGSVHLYFKEK